MLPGRNLKVTCITRACSFLEFQASSPAAALLQQSAQIPRTIGLQAIDPQNGPIH